MIDGVGADNDRFLEYFKIEKLANLPAAQYQHALNALEKKRQAASAKWLSLSRAPVTPASRTMRQCQ
jgi:hypothetical protein